MPLTMKLIDNLDEVKQVICNPLIWELISDDDSGDGSNWVPKSHLNGYLGGYKGETLVGLWELHPVTNRLVEVHINLLPEYWGKGYSKEMVDLGKQWLRDNTSFTKVIAYTPEVCTHVLSLMKSVGVLPLVTIKNSIKYKGQTCGLVLSEMEL